MLCVDFLPVIAVQLVTVLIVHCDDVMVMQTSAVHRVN